jgi:hypothetical protein
MKLPAPARKRAGRSHPDLSQNNVPHRQLVDAGLQEEETMHLSELAQRWRQRHSSLRELDGLGSDGLRELAGDVALQQADLYNLVSRSPADGALLPRLLASIGLDGDRVSRLQPAVMRDMARICAGCDSARRCRRELDREEAELSYRAYCPNAETIEALRR